MDDFWGSIDDEILDCVAARAMTPAEISSKLGMSEASVSSLLSMLAAEGKVRICAVEMR
jgi:DNA-binding transcriptional regulator LsrR (DeoR family)